MYGEVEYIDDRLGLNFVESALLRLGLCQDYIHDKVYRSICSQVADQEFDLYLAINVEGFGSRTLEYLATKAEKRILYMWDSFANKSGAIKLLRFFDKVITFDPNDAKNHGLSFIPLYYPRCYELESTDSNHNESYRIVMIGSLHSDRTRIGSIMQQNFSSFTAILYVRNAYLFAYRVLIGQVSWRAVNLISFKSLTHTQIASIYFESDIVVDYAHPGQTGLTNRSFEALAAGCGLITSNSSILNFEFFDDRKILFVEDWNDVDHIKHWVENIYSPSVNLELENYRIDNWLKKILNENSNV